jgi:hypothetical protein
LKESQSMVDSLRGELTESGKNDGGFSNIALQLDLLESKYKKQVEYLIELLNK